MKQNKTHRLSTNMAATFSRTTLVIGRQERNASSSYDVLLFQLRNVKFTKLPIEKDGIKKRSEIQHYSSEMIVYVLQGTEQYRVPAIHDWNQR